MLCVHVYDRVVMTWGSASCWDPPVRAPSALRSTTAITTYPLCPSRPSTFTDQVSQMKWSKSSLHRIPVECMDERDLLTTFWPLSRCLFLLSVSSWACNLPPSSAHMCSFHPLFSFILLLCSSSSSLSGRQECWSSAPLCAPATRALPPLSDITSSPIAKVRPLHSPLPNLFASFSVSISFRRCKSTPTSDSGLLKCLDCDFLACKAMLLAALFEKFTSPGVETLEWHSYEVKGCVWSVNPTEAHLMQVANA